MIRCAVATASVAVLASLTACGSTSPAPDRATSSASTNTFVASGLLTQVKADAQHVAVALGNSVASGQGVPPVLDAATLSGMGVSLVEGDSVVGFTQQADQEYAFCVVNTRGVWARYDSTSGAIVASGKSDPQC